MQTILIYNMFIVTDCVPKNYIYPDRLLNHVEQVYWAQDWISHSVYLLIL